MTAYLIVDVDDLLKRLENQGAAKDFYEIVSKLRTSASFAAGLPSPESLRAIAVGNWVVINARPDASSLQGLFQSAGFETFHLPERSAFSDVLLIRYFAFDQNPVDELIIVTNTAEIGTLIRRAQTTRGTRIRVWSDRPQQWEGVVVQPLNAILGLQSRTVSLYVDFENIAISLSEQGYAVDLDTLIDGIQRQANTHGQVTYMAAYAPWGQKNALPLMVDSQGRDITNEAMNRLLMAGIDPRVTLPGKNSADMRIAQDVLSAAEHQNASDLFIVASGDRDFNELFNALRARGKQVIIWGVRGTISRMLQNNPAFQVEFVDDFLKLPKRVALGATLSMNGTFTPSHWSSIVLQYDRIFGQLGSEGISEDLLAEQLRRIDIAPSRERARELIEQATMIGVLRPIVEQPGAVTPVPDHPIVERTRLVRDRVVARVANTLEVRNWEYVNYGFLLKGLAMDQLLNRPGLNLDDAWRSDWIDYLVREGLLVRELVPHRHNASDLVPVLKLASVPGAPAGRLGGGNGSVSMHPEDSEPRYAHDENDTEGIDLNIGADGSMSSAWDGDPSDYSSAVSSYLSASRQEVEAMMKRIIVSIDQFTSYRNFTWCPLGSLHKRLRDHDTGVSFQRAIEQLIEDGAVAIGEYDNPLSPYRTKGISLTYASPMVAQVLEERNQFIQILINLYNQHQPISDEVLATLTGLEPEPLALWLSIMQLENVLNPVINRPGTYTLFRGHHTVSLIAGVPPDDIG